MRFKGSTPCKAYLTGLVPLFQVSCSNAQLVHKAAAIAPGGNLDALAHEEGSILAAHLQQGNQASALDGSAGRTACGDAATAAGMMAMMAVTMLVAYVVPLLHTTG